MTWQVLFLQEFDEDLAELAGSHGVDEAKVQSKVLEQFHDPFKAQRIDDLLSSGTSTRTVDRLEDTQFPPSIRLRVLGDYRVTAWCYPAERQVVVTHLFHKGSDPRYRAAVRTHDARLSSYVAGMQGFLEKKRRR